MSTSKVWSFPPDVRRGSTVVDVGAHEGVWSEAILRVWGPTELVAVEPAPSSFSVLARRFAGREGIELHQCAVGDHEGTITLRLSNRPDFDSVLPLQAATAEHYAGVTSVGSVEVPLATLDELLSSRGDISVLKIDVQGFELPVIRGAQKVLSRTAVVLLETNFVSHYQGDALFADLHQAMTEAGFQFHRFALEYHDPHSGRLLWADAVYAR